MANALNDILKNIKSLRKTPSFWKLVTLSPMFKKNYRRKVENWRLISLLNIDSKKWEKKLKISVLIF